PQTVTLDEEPDAEQTDMTRRFWVGTALSLPLLIAVMPHLFGFDLAMMFPGRLFGWIQLALATPVVLWGGWPFFQRAWASVVHRSLNMFTLITLGTGTAYAYSAVATALPGIFPEPLRTHHGAMPVYFEAAAVITALVLLGQVLELR